MIVLIAPIIIAAIATAPAEEKTAATTSSAKYTLAQIFAAQSTLDGIQKRLERGDANEKKKAEEDLDRLIEQYPCFAPALCYRSPILILNGNKKGALDDISRAIECDPTNALYWYRRSLIKDRDWNDKQGALADLNNAVALDKDFLWTRGYLKEELGDTAGAIEDYLLAAQEGDHDANQSLAHLYFDMGNFEKFLEYNSKEQGFACGQDAPYLEYQLGVANLRTGKSLVAKDEFSRLIRRIESGVIDCKQFPDVFALSAEVKRALGDEEGAKKDLERQKDFRCKKP